MVGFAMLCNLQLLVALIYSPVVRVTSKYIRYLYSEAKLIRTIRVGPVGLIGLEIVLQNT